MLQIIGIDHIVLRTVVLDEMLQFYCDVLGCVVERSLPEIGLTQLRAGSALIDLVPVKSELGRLGGKAPSQDGRNLEHFCVAIQGLNEEQLIQYLEENKIEHEAMAERYGAVGFSKSVYIKDPEGNVVELKLNSKSKD
jgi:glyoxylase I family protein